ncbi:MAG: AMP-binding protein, partial [Leptospiraceae bacterium]|nr:AMP-binding protein [Leptospiraceae bacterium]
MAHHRGQHIMRGYYKEPEKTSATLLEGGWLNSGDLMVYTDRGFLKFAGRAKDTIVLLGGENLEPEPIEFALSQSQYVHQVIVVGQDKKTLGALIVPSQAAIEHHLKDMCEKNMPAMADYNNNDMIVNLFKREIKERISANNG